jgi:magnesium chelatase family protein
VPGTLLRKRWPVHNRAANALDDKLADGRISARGADRVLRLAWTLADLGGRPAPDDMDVEMALSLRTSDTLPVHGDRGSIGRARTTAPARANPTHESGPPASARPWFAPAAALGGQHDEGAEATTGDGTSGS